LELYLYNVAGLGLLVLALFGVLALMLRSSLSKARRKQETIDLETRQMFAEVRSNQQKLKENLEELLTLTRQLQLDQGMPEIHRQAIQLHHQGIKNQDIAGDLRIPRGEVDVLVKLSAYRREKPPVEEISVKRTA
jgi:DNA-directed RNA polymerase specialized sigma24 family protein